MFIIILILMVVFYGLALTLAYNVGDDTEIVDDCEGLFDDDYRKLDEDCRKMVDDEDDLWQKW